MKEVIKFRIGGEYRADAERADGNGDIRFVVTSRCDSVTPNTIAIAKKEDANDHSSPRWISEVLVTELPNGIVTESASAGALLIDALGEMDGDRCVHNVVVDGAAPAECPACECEERASWRHCKMRECPVRDL